MRNLDLTKNRSGYYCLRVPIIGSRRSRLVSTQERNLERAAAVVAAAGADRLVLLANAGVMTPEVIAVATTGRTVALQGLIDSWGQRIEQDGSPATRRNFESVAKMFLRQFGLESRTLQAVTRDQLHEFINAPDLKFSSRQRRQIALRGLWRHAISLGLVIGCLPDSITVQHRDLSQQQMERDYCRACSEEEYRRMIEPGALPDFWRTITILSYCTGLRLSDAFHLQSTSFRPGGLVVWTGKTGRRVELPLDHPLIGRPELLELVPRLTRRSNTHFCFKEHKTYRQSTATGAFQRHAKALGLEGISFHGLRRAFAQRLEAAGTSVEQIAGLMGHASTATTEQYLDAKA